MINTPVFIVVVLLLLSIGVVSYNFLNRSPSPVSQKLTPKKIAMLVASDLQLATVDGIKDGLRGFGYIEDQDVNFEINNPNGDRDLTKQMAKAIVEQKPDLIVPISTTATAAVQEASAGTGNRIVFVDVANIKELKITDTKHPGGNITGVTSDTVTAGAKRMEILKEVVPKARVFGIIMNPKHVSASEIRKVHEAAAKALNLNLKYYELSSKEELDTILAKIEKDKPDGVMTTSEAIISNNAELIASRLRKAKIPSIDFNAERGVKSGYLMMFGLSRYDTGKQGARLIDKVLKGSSPGDLPIEFAQESRLELNKEVAAEIGIVFTDTILRRGVKGL